MIGFLIRKSFYAFRDNLFKIVLLNLMFYAMLFAMIVVIVVSIKLHAVFAVQIALQAACLFLVSIFLEAAARTVSPISDGKSFEIKDFFDNLCNKKTLQHGVAGGILACILSAILFYAVPFFALFSTAGLFIAALLFWIFIAALLMFQFFLVSSRLDGKLFNRSGGEGILGGGVGTIRKCAIFFSCDPLFAIFCFACVILQTLISVFTIFIAPGPVGIILFLDQALRLRTLKNLILPS
jgi:hypothetical protein